MPVKKTMTSKYDLLGAYTISGYEYDLRSYLKLWVDFAESPSDRSVYSSDISTIEYEGSVTSELQTIGSIQYNVARFDDSENLNALISYNSTTNPTSFGDGSNDSPFSISFWYNRDSTYESATQEVFFEKGDDTAAKSEYRGKISSSGYIEFQLTDASSGGTETYSAYHPDCAVSFNIDDINDEWDHYAFTYDGSSGRNGMTVYVNGVELSSPARSGAGSYTSLESVSDKFFIGADKDGNAEADGYMAEFSVFSKELTANEIQSIYLGTKDKVQLTVIKSGRINNPVRTIIKDLDNKTGAYPTVHRMNRKDNTGILSNIVFDDTKTIKFGNAIKDDFTIEEDNVFSRQVNSSLWEVSTSDVLVKKEFDPASDLELTTGAVVLGGAGDSDGRWLKTKNKIANPTLVFSLLQGPYNNTGALANFKLNLGQGQITDTFKIQASIDGTNWDYDIDITANNLGTTYSDYINLDSGVLQPTPIFTFFNGITGEQQNTSGQQKKPVLNIKLDIQDFSKAGLREPFYLRFIQSSISDDNIAVWAIGHVNIISREEQVTYPHLGVNDHATNYHLTQSIATPNYIGSLVSSGSSISNISDSKILSFSDQTASPFNEESVTDFRNDGFYTVGTKEDTLPGFNSSLLSKTKFKLTLSASEETQIGLIYPPPINNNFSYQNMMCYYNFTENKWEYGALQGFRRYDQDLTDLIESSSIGFGSLNLIGESQTTSLSTPIRYPDFTYNGDFFVASGVRPTNTFGFPSHVKFAPQTGSGQTIKAKEIGITKPFLLEKIKVSFDASMQFSDIEDGSPSSQYYSLEGVKWSGSNYGIFNIENTEIYIPTFFMLRNFKDSVEFTNNVQYINQVGSATVQNYKSNLSIPSNRYIVDRDSGTPDTFNDNVLTNRELISYGQFTVYRSGSEEPGAFINVFNDSTNYTFIDAPFGSNIINALTRDAKLLTITSSTNNLEINQLTMEFPCRSPIISQDVFSTFDIGKSGTDYTVILDSAGGRTPITVNSLSRNISSAFNPNLTLLETKEINIADGLTTELTKTLKIAGLNSFDRTSPYLIFPEDELIIGWQYPLPRKSDAGIGSGDDEFDEFSMTLKGITNIELFGSQVKDGKEFHEGLNQNLTSNVVHEVIGSEPVIDQWQIETRGELTGSFSDQFSFSTLDTDNNVSYVIGRNIAFFDDNLLNTTHANYVIGINPIQRIKAKPYSDALPIPAFIYPGNVLSITQFTTNSTLTSRFNNDFGKNLLLPQINRFESFVDPDRQFSDADTKFQKNLTDNGSGNLNAYGVAQTLATTLMLPGTGIKNLGGRPKYYFNKKHYGFYIDNLRQGLDGKFKRVIERGNQTITEAAVRIKFVEDDYDEENLNFRKFSLIKAGDIDGTSEELFQSSNLSLFATSSLPFFDDNTARNRTYGTETVEVV